MGTVVAHATDLVSFAPGYPDPTLFPWDDLRNISATLLTGADADALQYGATRGYEPLLETLVDVLDARDIHVSADELLITTGSQQGLDLAARVLVDPGDVVLVELPTYVGAITAFRNVQATMVGIPQERDGINLAALDATWTRLSDEGRRVKFVYVVPNFQNPTGLLIGLDKRRALIEWAGRLDVLIVEDDPFRSFPSEHSSSVPA